MLRPLNRQTVPAHTTLPEKIVQFGGGNFLRAFADWMVDILNEEAGLAAGVVIVKPTASGAYTDLIAQDGLYHVRLTGGGDADTRLIRCINRIINPYTSFEAYLSLAQQPSVRFILSNTTEAGITFDPDDRLEDRSANSFPGKLTQFLHARFRHFDADPGKGCIILPCELVEQNGDQLGQIVRDYANLWGLESEFAEWLDAGSVFCNTLVDRIVPGFPQEKATAIWEKIGYEDRLLVEAEAYHQWVIEAPAWAAAELPVQETALNVRFVEDITPYRELKVRILNGAHTAMTPVGYLCGLDTVREVVEDEVVGPYITGLLQEEVLPVLDFPPAERQSYMDAILERFHNPDIQHQLLDIALNSLSKFRVRLLPTLLAFQAEFGHLPKRIVFALAALVHLYRGQRNGEPFSVRDDPAVLAWFNQLWLDGATWEEMAGMILQQDSFWRKDLTAVPGLQRELGRYLEQIHVEGMQGSLRQVVAETE